jgi:proline iminopeptidase
VTETTTRAVRGVEIFERRAGSGPATVVLHGGPGAHHDYLLPGFDALATGRTLIYYDQRGGGQSPVARNVPVGWTEHVADLEALRSLWGLDRLTLLGYSWAGSGRAVRDHHPTGSSACPGLRGPAWRAARTEFERRFHERTMSPALQAEAGHAKATRAGPGGLPAAAVRVVGGWPDDPSQVGALTPSG